MSKNRTKSSVLIGIYGSQAIPGTDRLDLKIHPLLLTYAYAVLPHNRTSSNFHFESTLGVSANFGFVSHLLVSPRQELSFLLSNHFVRERLPSNHQLKMTWCVHCCSQNDITCCSDAKEFVLNLLDSGKDVVLLRK